MDVPYLLRKLILTAIYPTCPHKAVFDIGLHAAFKSCVPDLSYSGNAAFFFFRQSRIRRQRVCCCVATYAVPGALKVFDYL